MIIVCEGPDNAGKTTFGQWLAKQMRAVFIKVERPSKGVDLLAYQGLLHEAEKYSGVVVTDRHVAISEPIYGNIIRGGHPLKQADIDMCLGELHAVVYCRPHSDIILRSLTVREQMAGVVENATAIVQAYDKFFDPPNWDLAPSLLYYDYKQTPKHVVLERLDQLRREQSC